MTVRIENHGRCNGTGRIPNDDAGRQHQCSACAGHGVLKASGSSYRSAANAQIGINHKSARECYICQGKGYRVVPADGPCYGGCSDGKIVVEAHVGDALPTEIDRTATIPKPVAAMIAAELDIVVSAENRGGTWNEAHLGLGTLWSTTDYGTTWGRLMEGANQDRELPVVNGSVSHLAQAIDGVREDIRRKIATESTQWVKLIDSETRVVTNTVVVAIHRNGYTVVSRPSIESGNHAMLPPTYTAELLNREVN